MGSIRVAAIALLLTLGFLPAGSASGTRTTGSATATLAFVSGLTRGLSLTETGLVQRPLRKTRSVYEFAWSPDGRRIAFIGAGQYIHVVSADGSGSHRLPAKVILSGLAWSPDSRRLAYTGSQGTASHLYVVSASGGAPRVLPASIPVPVLPSWSSQGTIAFATARSDLGRIYRIEADGTRLRALTPGIGDSFPTWSPDGRLLAFQRHECRGRSCGYSLYVMRSDGSQQHRVARTLQYPGSLSVAWSPDARKIAFVRPRTAMDSRDQIMVVNARGDRLRNLTRGVSDATSPAWSPDGRTIAYGSASSIYLMNPDGSGKRLFVEYGGMPAWQPRR